MAQVVEHLLHKQEAPYCQKKKKEEEEEEEEEEFWESEQEISCPENTEAEVLQVGTGGANTGGLLCYSDCCCDNYLRDTN
jgi:CO dehydrogenase/acetyl-CoA synthase beta subunit